MSGSSAGAAKGWGTRRAVSPMRINLAHGRPRGELANIVAAGVDTLHLHSTARLRPERVGELIDLKAQALEARESGGPAPSVTYGTLRLTVAHHGTGKGALLLTSDDAAIIVNPDAPPGLPTVLVELRAQFLWAAGYLDAVHQVSAALENLCADSTAELEVTRLDLCVDFVGWAPTADMRDAFMCRAQRRAELHEEWRRAGGRGKVVKAFRKAAGTGDALARDVLDRLLEHDELTTGSYYSGKTFTGFSFGAGCVVSRLYLKTRELKKSGKGWMREVWARDASVGGLALIYRGRPVWRLEFQLRRELLKDAKASDGPAFAQGRVVVENRQRVEPHAVFARWSTAAPLLADLWRYLMTDWLELRLPRRADTRRTPRQAWVALRERAEFKGSVPCFGVWRRHIEDARVRTLGQAGGYAARGLAERWALDNAADVVPDRLEPEAELQRWLKELRSYAQAHRGDVVDRALERWDLLNYRRQLYGAAAV